LEKDYLPSLHGSVLFVGVGPYTDFYSRCVQTPELYETIDNDPGVANHGSPYGHYVADILNFNPGKQYDHVCMFGILGHKDSDWEVMNTEVQWRKCFSRLDQLV